jgi:2-amino-4-hydroxy-6-hydroxymethyldihydropteridine diphosphokinase
MINAAMPPSIVHLALGSNLGDRAANLREAARRLGEAVRVVKVSSFHETEPVGGPPGQPRFLNAALEIETAFTPIRLLECTHGIEAAMGRKPGPRWGPRLIDVDILLFESTVMESAELTLPHPRMHERRFVLAPLAEIAPLAIHPVLQKTVVEMLEGLEK